MHRPLSCNETEIIPYQGRSINYFSCTSIKANNVLPLKCCL